MTTNSISNGGGGGSIIARAEELKGKGNDAFRKGDVPNAIECYTSALNCIDDNLVKGETHDDDASTTNTTTSVAAATLLSNRAMCHLKAAEQRRHQQRQQQQSTAKTMNRNADDGAANDGRDDVGSSSSGSASQSLQCCVDDCTKALDHLDNTTTTNSNSNSNNDNGNNSLRGKILYRRARASLLAAARNTLDINDDDDAKETDLNAAAEDLLRLLSFDAKNEPAAALLRDARRMHGLLGGGMGRTRVSRALDCLTSMSSTVASAATGGDGDGGDDNNGKQQQKKKKKNRKGEEGSMDALQCLHVLQGCLVEDVSSSSDEIGRRGGLSPLLRIARRGVVPSAATAATDREKCRVAALHVLSACCSHDPFVLRYASRESLPPRVLAQMVEEEAALSNNAIITNIGNNNTNNNNNAQSSNNNNNQRGSSDVAVAATALLLRLIVHWDRREAMRFFAPEIREDGTAAAAKEERPHHNNSIMGEVDGSVVCRVAKAAFSWGTNNNANSDDGGDDGGDGADKTDGKAPRAALDLLSAWTASDLDALDAASDACYAPSDTASSSNSNGTNDDNKRRASQHKITAEDVRRMKPRQVAAHRKRESQYKHLNTERAISHVAALCSEETGGLDSMLTCAAETRDHRLRREVGLAVGRMMSAYNDHGESANGGDDEVKRLVARALGCSDWRVGREEEEEDGGNGGGGGLLSSLTIEELDEGKEEGTEEDDDDAAKLFAAMKRGQLTASLLLGKPPVGTWALKHGWSDSLGIRNLELLISSDHPVAMSIASELVSAASSVEGSRPLLISLVEEGTLEELLMHPDANVRSGAASCAAKIGLASKALSADEGEVMGLLDVAVELLFEDGDDDDDDDSRKEEAASLTKKVPQSKPVGESTSMDRGIEVLAYLASKTFVKERIVAGYIPPGSPPGRKTTLHRLVEIACSRSRNSGGDNNQMAYGLAGIFDLLAVSIETLRREAFVGKEITKEQYDQLQSLGKTEEEKDAEARKDEREGDDAASVGERIRKLAGANVPRAMVKLLEGGSSGGSDATQEKLLEGMGRMASEASVRGSMIQQGCLTTCLQLDKGDKPNESEKKILRLAQSCIAKLLVTTNPAILTVSQRSGSVLPLLKLVKDNDALDLHHFEALMSLTNLAGHDNETKERVIKQKGLPTLSYAMFSDHEMVRQAATEAVCNMIPHPEMMEYLGKEDNLKVWMAFAVDYEEPHFGCARAAMGCLAMAAPYDPEFARSLVGNEKFGDMIRTMLECGQLELMHRTLALIVSLIEHGGVCREAVVATGAGPFCDAYVASYRDEKKTMKDFEFSPAERGALAATLSLAKEVATLLR